MRVQNVNLGFCAEPKKNESVKNSNIFLCALGGSLIGAAGGAVARNYMPFADEFTSKSAETKREIEESLNNYIDDYGSLEIDEARALKTVLKQPDVAVHQNSGLKIDDILEDDSIKVVEKEDNEELQSTFKALHSKISEEIKDAEDKKNLPEKLKSINEMTSDVHSKAKQAVFVKENLRKYKNQIKGLLSGGDKTISSVTDKIEKSTEGSDEMRKELGGAFNNMIKTAKHSQRPIEVWTIIPAIAFGLLGMAFAVNRQLKKDIFDKTKKEPFKSK